MWRLLHAVVRHPLWSHYLTLIIVAFGLIALFSMRREARPPVNFDRVAINMTYRGASAEDVEQLIIKPIEEKLEEVDGIDEVRATAFEGQGQLSVKLDPDYSEKDQVADDIQRVVDQITAFPESAEDPIITEIKAANIPVIRIALFGQTDELTLRKTADWVKDQMQLVEGVSKVDAEGLRELQLQVETAPKRLSRARVSIAQIMDSIRAWNVDSPGGSIDDGQRDVSIRIRGQFREAKELAKLPIRANDAGQVLRISDIADVKLGLKDEDLEYLYNGDPAIILTVVKKENVDTIKTVERVKNRLNELRTNLPEGLNLKTFRDDSQNIRVKLKIVQTNAIIGLTLVLITLMLTLSFRMALVTAIGLPIAFLGGLAVIWLYGFTINTLVVLGMIVVLGMLVDDAIVVSENIHYHLERGVPPHEAAAKGAHQVSAAVTATVLTTMLAFLPLVFMREIIGKFIRVMPVVVIFMLLFSLLESLLILPNHAAEMFRTNGKRVKTSKFFERIQGQYARYVRWSLNHKWTLFWLVTAYLAVSAAVGATQLKFVLFPTRGVEGLNIRVEAPSNTSRNQTRGIAQELNRRLEPFFKEDITSIQTIVGQTRVGGLFGIRERGPHLARLDVRFTDEPDFARREKQVLKKMRKVISGVEEEFGVETNVAISRVGPPIGRPIQVQISGREFEQTQEVTKKILGHLEEIKGVKDIQSDLESLNEELRIEVNKTRATELGVGLDVIATTIFTAFDGIPASETRKGNDEMEIIVTFPESLRGNQKNILKIPIQNAAGQYVPLGSVAKVMEAQGRNAIQRLDARRTITVFGDVDETNLTSRMANAKLGSFINTFEDDYPETAIELGGEEKDRQKAVADTVRLFGLAILGIFIVISLAFESVIFPFFVVLTIPFGLAGIVWALLLHASPLTMMGLIGIVGLSGVVVNSSIIMVQFILRELKRGQPIREAIVNGATRRLRPIILTTTTTLSGLFPAIYGIGGEDALVQPLALTLGWGLFFATILILLALPSLLMISERVVRPPT